MSREVVIFWFRRDLRLNDNVGLYHALNSGYPVLPIFIFDTTILARLSLNTDPRVNFIYNQITELKQNLESYGSTLEVFYNNPEDTFKSLIQKYKIKSVFTNNDYEPYAVKRDINVGKLLASNSIRFNTYKDHLIFEKGEVVKDNGQPYTVYTPYSRKWKQLFEKSEMEYFETDLFMPNLIKRQPTELPALQLFGFNYSNVKLSPSNLNQQMFENYAFDRDFPGLEGTSKIGIHLRFGTISIREVINEAVKFSPVFLNELIWREFYSSILWHFPNVENEPFKQKYNFIQWRNNEEEFYLWCIGKTGYPFVDAGMRQLNETGYMHNRLRMVTASFLTKHLLIDWRWGEAYFAERLLDFELASNNGGWQWAAGTGCDAAPYFRIFNPESQQKKFDKEFKYILKWVPEYGTVAYPQPMVDHRFARERALAAYKKALDAPG